MLKRTTLIAVLAVAVLSMIAPSAQAMPTRLDPEAQQTIASVSVRSWYSQPPVRDATGRVCSQRSVEVVVKNVFGVWLYKFGNSARGCARAGRVVGIDWNVPWADTSVVSLWRYDGSYIEELGGGEGSRYAYRQWRGHFHNCVTWVCKDRFPYVYLGFRGDGTWGTRGGH